jgi:hypothetical protein
MTTTMRNTEVLPRLFEANLTHEEFKINFDAREVKTRVEITAYGIPFAKATDLVSLATGHEDANCSGNHLRLITKKNPDLEHNDKQLRDHIEVFAIDMLLISY